MIAEQPDLTKLNNELLRAEDDEKLEKGGDRRQEPKRNSKDDLIKKILTVVEKYSIEFDYSDTKMKRMSKTELHKLLASVMEQCVKIDMAKAAGVDPRSNGKVITMGALRMLHNLAATGFESVYNSVGPAYTGYYIDGFSKALREPMIAESVDECLVEIAKDNPEILDYFDSPYTRLMLVWGGALMMCVRRTSAGPPIINTRSNKNGSIHVGPAPSRGPDTVRTSGGGEPKMRKVDEHLPHRVPNVRSV